MVVVEKGSGLEMVNILIDLALDRSWVDVDIDVDVRDHDGLFWLECRTGTLLAGGAFRVNLARFPYLTSGRRSIHMEGMSVMFLKTLLVHLNLKKSSGEITSDISRIPNISEMSAWLATNKSLSHTGMLPKASGAVVVAVQRSTERQTPSPLSNNDHIPFLCYGTKLGTHMIPHCFLAPCCLVGNRNRFDTVDCFLQHNNIHICP